MSISIKQNELYIKNSDGTYTAQNLFLNESSAARIAEIEAAARAALETIPSDYQTLFADFAPIYNPESRYSIGEYVMHNGELYKCRTSINTPEEWNNNRWTKVSFSEQIRAAEQRLDNILDSALTDITKAANAKAVGDRLTALEEDVNVNIHQTIDSIIDTSLSITNKAAEAAAVGNRFATNETAFTNLKNKVDSIIDNTLTLENKAAGSAAVGNKFTELSEQIQNILDSLQEISGSIQQDIIDKTLTLEDKAAEAKATGDALSALSTSLAATDAKATTASTNADTANSNVSLALPRLTAVQESLSGFETDLQEAITGAEVKDDGLYLTRKEGQSLGPFQIGGGGGGSSSNYTISLTNNTGWSSKTIPNNGHCQISFTWSSVDSNNLPSGDGVLSILINRVQRISTNIQQGLVNYDITNILQDSTRNRVEVRVTDIEGSSRSIFYTVTSAAISISSNFDNSQPFSDSILFPFTPNGGNFQKTIHLLVDNRQIMTQTITANWMTTYTIPKQSHGSHVIEIYFVCTIEGNEVESNHLKYEIICIESDKNTPIIISDFEKTTINQYQTLNLGYRIYSNNPVTGTIINVNGVQVLPYILLNRDYQIFSYRPTEVGNLSIEIIASGASRVFNLEVLESRIDSKATTENLELYLTSSGRSNNDSNRDAWKFTPAQGDPITATLNNFTYVTDGWVLDGQKDPITQKVSGVPTLRVKGNARVNIPFKIFGSNFINTGKTIEIEFSTRDVLNYDSTIISCWANNIGLKVTAQRVFLQGDQTGIELQYKENEHIRISFVIENNRKLISGTTDTSRLLLVYINGVLSRTKVYSASENFSQGNQNAVGITIGSNECTTDIYNIRVYNNDLTYYQILDNWIADCLDYGEMFSRWQRNQIYDEYKNVDLDSLPADLPVLIFEAPKLPQFKGDYCLVNGSFTDTQNPTNNFTFQDCRINVQGTSSAPYERKNYDFQFKPTDEAKKAAEQQGIDLKAKVYDYRGNEIKKYSLQGTQIPNNRFVFKADVASSESVNNTGLTSFYDEAVRRVYTTPEQRENPLIRQGIYGFPIVVFWENTDTNQRLFLGKYNFNFPKRAPNVLGFTGTMESWEWQNNTDQLSLFKSDNFYEPMRDANGEIVYEDQLKTIPKPVWKNAFEARFPEDTWGTLELREFAKLFLDEDEEVIDEMPEQTLNQQLEAIGIPYMTKTEQLAQLQTFISWVYSTDRQGATNNTFSSPKYLSYKTYTINPNGGLNATSHDNEKFLKDTPQYRIAKFRADCEKYVELDSALFYYIFTELFLMVDSRAKNMFPSFNGSESPIENIRRKVVFMPYDMDTALGTNNEGQLIYGYDLEDKDTINNGQQGVFNGYKSVFWNNLRDCYGAHITNMYRSLRSSGTFSYDTVENMYQTRQNKWPQAIFNEDSMFKYIFPYADPTKNLNNGPISTTQYLPMLQGSKAEQRKWWLNNRFYYMDSKWFTGTATTQVISFRTNVAGYVHIKPYINMYINVRFGTNLMTQRGEANTQTVFYFSPQGGSGSGSEANDTETYIYSASQIAELGDLSSLYLKTCDVSSATKLQYLKLGDASPSYQNYNLAEVKLSNAIYLRSLDIRNCVNYAQSINASNCVNLVEVYLEGTKVSGFISSNGGVLETVHFPETLSSLTLLNQTTISDFVLPSLQRLNTIHIVNPSTTVMNWFYNNILSFNSGARISIEGFYAEFNSLDEVNEFYDELLNCGYTDLNENPIPYIQGKIYIAASISGEEVAQLQEKFPYIEITAEHITFTVNLYKWDGSYLIDPFTLNKSADGTYFWGGVGSSGGSPESNPSLHDNSGGALVRNPDAQYTYKWIGWNLDKDSQVAIPNVFAVENITKNLTLYAAYRKTLREYTITWRDADNTTLLTESYKYGETPTYKLPLPTNSEGEIGKGWIPKVKPVTGNQIYVISYEELYNIDYYSNEVLFNEMSVKKNSTPTYITVPRDSLRSNADTFRYWLPNIYNKSDPTSVNNSSYYEHINRNYKLHAKFQEDYENKLIEDSWEEIIETINNREHRKKYKVGNYKPLSFMSGNTQVTLNMQIAGFDVDPLSNQQDEYAATSWIAKELLEQQNIKTTNTSLITNYKFVYGNSWTMGNNNTYWTSNNMYYIEEETNKSQASLNLTITTGTSGNLNLQVYTNNNSTAYGYVDLYVNNIKVLENFAGNRTYSVGVNEYTDTIVRIVYTNLSSTNGGYATLNISHTGSISSIISEVPSNETKHRVFDYYTDGSSSIGGWKYTTLRTNYLQNVLTRLPVIIKNNIKQVEKYQIIYNTQGNSLYPTSYANREIGKTSDSLWIPSYYEIQTYSSVYDYPINPYYTYTRNASKQKYLWRSSDTPGRWWLRDNYTYSSSYGYFAYVDPSGSVNYSSYYNYSSSINGIGTGSNVGNNYVVLGFCL